MKKKIISLLTSAIMIIAMMASTVSMAEPGGNAEAGTVPQETKEVTLHKLLLTAEELKTWDENGPEGYDGTQNLDAMKTLTGKALNEIKGVYFAWQNEAGEYINSNGEVVKVNNEGTALGTGEATDRAITINDDKKVFMDNVLGMETTQTGAPFNTSKLPAGKYKIQEIHKFSTYVGIDGAALTANKAVPVEITLPLVNDNGPQASVHVYPKNTEDKPPTDKDFAPGFGSSTGANPDTPRTDKGTNVPSVNIGDEIPYEVKTKIPVNSNYKVLKWTDTMSRGLTYNKDLVIKLGETALVENTDYTIEQTLSGFVLKIIDDETNGLGKINKKAIEQTITLTYTATVNSDAQVDTNEKNDVILEFGNNPGEEHEPVETTPKENKIIVNKTWEAGVTKKDIVFDLFEKVTKTTATGTETDWRLVESKTLKTIDGLVEFTGLEEGKSYKVVERPSGFVPEYSLGEGNGAIIVNNKGSKNPPPLNPDEPQVVTHGKKFVKTNQDGKERLAGAEFVIKNAEGKYLVLKSDAAIAGDEDAYTKAQKAYEKAIADYNTWIKANQNATPEQIKTEKAKIQTAKDARDEAFDKARYQYTWGTKAQAYKLVSDNEGRFEIKGLAAGTYNLEEIKPPAGYAKRSGDVPFTVAKGSYNGASTEMQYNPDSPESGYGQQVINKKVDIPQTGGMGTILFTVVGLALMTVAFIALRKRNNEQ